MASVARPPSTRNEQRAGWECGMIQMEQAHPRQQSERGGQTVGPAPEKEELSVRRCHPQARSWRRWRSAAPRIVAFTFPGRPLAYHGTEVDTNTALGCAKNGTHAKQNQAGSRRKAHAQCSIKNQGKCERGRTEGGAR
eukprot:2181199-Rhodomonas_salina.2